MRPVTATPWPAHRASMRGGPGASTVRGMTGLQRERATPLETYRAGSAVTRRGPSSGGQSLKTSALDVLLGADMDRRGRVGVHRTSTKRPRRLQAPGHRIRWDGDRRRQRSPCLDIETPDERKRSHGTNARLCPAPTAQHRAGAPLAARAVLRHTRRGSSGTPGAPPPIASTIHQPRSITSDDGRTGTSMISPPASANPASRSGDGRE